MRRYEGAELGRLLVTSVNAVVTKCRYKRKWLQMSVIKICPNIHQEAGSFIVPYGTCLLLLGGCFADRRVRSCRTYNSFRRTIVVSTREGVG